MSDTPSIVRPARVDSVPSEAMAELVEASNTFAFEFWRRFGRAGENLAVSPASIHLALSMVLAGAGGKTAEEIARAMRLANPEAVHEAAAALLRDWNDPDRSDYELRVISRLFGEQGFRFKADYLQFAVQYYGAPLEELDFRSRPEPSRARINAWIAEATANRIQNPIPPGALDDLTRLVLVNVVYFLGDWAEPFETIHTRRSRFFLQDGGFAPVPMMTQTTDVLYHRGRDLKFIELPYVGHELAMTILLPDTVDGLPALEERLSAGKLDDWIAKLQHTEVEIDLPRFTIDPPDSIDLIPVLNELGMNLAFRMFEADLTGIAAAPDPEDRLYINAARHKCFVKVDESGTEAVGATIFEVVGASGPLSQPERFRADHPFLFVIRDVRSGMIFFVGRVTEPHS